MLSKGLTDYVVYCIICEMVVHKQFRARKKIRKFIAYRLKGINKYKALIMAGYAPSTARNAELVESTNTYKIVMQELLDTNANMLQQMNNSMFSSVQNGDFDTLDMDTRSKIMQRLVDMHTKLTPKVTVKQEETGLDGVKRTLWSEKQA